ncbi:hypothetical protein ACTHAM_002385 [Cellulomonas soli]|uniref:hypothetical protein n=1 Tax=Cellulomonas soli TaxID=931535 RepID=UPI003F85B7C1
MSPRVQSVFRRALAGAVVLVLGLCVLVVLRPDLALTGLVLPLVLALAVFAIICAHLVGRGWLR